MITPTNRPSSNPVYFGRLMWVDSVAQHHTWSTTVRAAEVELGERTAMIYMLPHKMVINKFRGLIANCKYGRPSCSIILRVFKHTRPLQQLELHDGGSHWTPACA